MTSSLVLASAGSAGALCRGWLFWAALDHGLPPKGRADDSGAVRSDMGGHLQDFARGRDHQLPGLDHDELPSGIPKVPEKPDSLGLARSGEHGEVAVLRQRETGVQIRVCVGKQDVVSLAAREDDRVQGNRRRLPVCEVAESPGWQWRGIKRKGGHDVLRAVGPRCRAPAAGASTPSTVPTASTATMVNRLMTASLNRAL